MTALPSTADREHQRDRISFCTAKQQERPSSVGWSAQLRPGEFHMKVVAVLMLAAMGVASMAEAQTMGTSTVTGQAGAGQVTDQPTQAQAPTIRMGPDGTFKDECGFRYNSRGDRINARGRVLPPPVTPPGGGSCK